MPKELFDRFMAGLSDRDRKIVEGQIGNYEKHLGCLVRNLERKRKTAFDLASLIGEGSTVAHAIWYKYCERGKLDE